MTPVRFQLTDQVAVDSSQTVAMIDEFRRDLIEVNGHTYSLEWLAGPLAEAVPAPSGYWDD